MKKREKVEEEVDRVQRKNVIDDEEEKVEESRWKERILQFLLLLSPPFLRVTLRDVNYRAI